MYRNSNENYVYSNNLINIYNFVLIRNFSGKVTCLYCVYRKQATHPNMRTYYFSTDAAKDMESWMKVMTDAALVHTEPIRR